MNKPQHTRSRTVLYISYDGMTDPLGQSQVIPYLKGLAALGHRIVLMSFEKKQHTHLQPHIQDLLSKAGIKWEKMVYHKTPALPATLLDLCAGSVRAMVLVRRHKVNIIHCRGHYIVPVMAAFARLLRPAHFLFDMRGFWADERLDGNIWSLEKPLHKAMYKFFKRMEKWYLTSAAQVVVLTHKASEYLQQNFTLKRTPVVVACAADLDFFTPQNIHTRNTSRTKLNLENKFVLCYLGSLGTWYMVDEMLAYFKRLLLANASAHFLIITKDDPNEVTVIANNLKIEPAAYTIIPAERGQVPALLAAADASIFFIKPVFSKMASSPTKHGEILGCGLPLVCNTGVGDVEEIVSKSNTGILIREFNDSAYDASIAPLLQLVAEKPAQKCRAAAEKYYSLQKGVERYHAIYQSLD